MCLRLGNNEQTFWFYWCFPTNRAHALDLCLVSISMTHFSQLPENPTSEDPRLMNMHTERRCYQLLELVFDSNLLEEQ